MKVDMKFNMGFWKQIAAVWSGEGCTKRQANIEETAENVVRLVQKELYEHQTVSRIPSAIEAIFGDEDQDDDFF